MNINKENFIETTTKFNELKKRFNSNMKVDTGVNVSTTEHKLLILQSTVNEMLTLLDEMVRS